MTRAYLDPMAGAPAGIKREIIWPTVSAVQRRVAGRDDTKRETRPEGVGRGLAGCLSSRRAVRSSLRDECDLRDERVLPVATGIDGANGQTQALHRGAVECDGLILHLVDQRHRSRRTVRERNLEPRDPVVV